MSKYIRTYGLNGYFAIPTFQITANTKVKCKVIPRGESAEKGWFGNNNSFGEDKFCIRNNTNNNIYANVNLQSTSVFTYTSQQSDVYGHIFEIEMKYDTVIINGNSVVLTGTSIPFTPSGTEFRIGSNQGTNTSTREPIDWEYFQIYDGNTLVYDLVPAYNDNKYCFLNRVNNTYLYATGTVDGEVSSINATPSKTSIAASGETINIVVDTENAWTVTGDTWLTLSSTGDTGSTTITATAPSYTGATVRTETLTFTDSVTGDEVEITITQKKCQNGQPMYLGEDTIYEFYLGGDPISEMYLGEVLVYSSGPFVGLKTSPKRVGFTKNDLSATLKIKSSESWSLTAPAWVTASPTTGDTGETVVTLTTTVQTADTSSTISIVSSSFSASVEVSYKNYVNPVADNEMWYTSLNNVVVPPYRTPAQFTSSSQSSQGLQQSIISNAYDQDKGCNVIVWGLDLEMTPGSGFYRKTELVDVKYGNKLTLEGPENFTGCTNLTAITYGESEELELNEGAWPPNLQAVYCHCKTEPREGAYDARGNFGRFCTKAGVFHYPQGKNWSTFISKLPSGWTAVDDL